MADAKWHPATGDFGVFGDYGPGKEGSRADRAAKRAVSSLQEQYDLVKGREGNIDEYYNLLESLSSKEYDTRERGVDLARTELVQQGKGLDLQRAGIDLEKEGMGRKETSALDNFLTASRTLETKGNALTRKGRGLVSGEVAQAISDEKTGVQQTTATSLAGIRDQLKALGLTEDKIDLMEDQYALQGQGLTLRDQMLALSREKDTAAIGKARIDEQTALQNLLFQLETMALDYGGNINTNNTGAYDDNAGPSITSGPGTRPDIFS